MSYLILALGVIIFVAYLANKLNKKEDEADKQAYDKVVAGMDDTQNYVEMNQKNETTKPDTIGLMFNTLSNIGCQPTKNPDGTLSVQYQGENFQMVFGGMYARIWDPMWAQIKADDPDLPQVREAVNAANFNFGPTVVLTAPNDEGIIGFHSRRDIMLHPACPDNEPFVKAVLDSFFEAKNQVRQSYQQLNARQVESQKKCRPIGFTAESQTAQNAEKQ